MLLSLLVVSSRSQAALCSNSRNRAVMEIETDILSKRVEKHNTLIERTYRLEQDMAVIQHDVQSLAERSE